MDKGLFDWLYYDQQTLGDSGLRICVDTYNNLISSKKKSLAYFKEKYKNKTGLAFISSAKHFMQVFSDKDFTIEIPKNKSGSLSFSKGLWPKLKDEEMRTIMQGLIDSKYFISLYGNKFVEFMKHRDGKVFIHPRFHDGVTKRLLTKQPNLLNLPKVAGSIRECIIPNNEGDIILSADYSAQEFRILADVSADRPLIDAMLGGLDIHTYTKEAVGMDSRSVAKTFNFAIVYGSGDKSISESTNIPVGDVRAMRAKMAQVMPGVFDFSEKIKAFTKKFGFIVNCFGRRLNTPPYKAYAGLNYFIQGTAADVIRLAIKNMYKFYSQEMRADGVQILLQVYDSLIISVPKGKKDKWAKILEQVMIGSYRPMNGLNMEVDIEYKYKNLFE